MMNRETYSLNTPRIYKYIIYLLFYPVFPLCYNTNDGCLLSDIGIIPAIDIVYTTAEILESGIII